MVLEALKRYHKARKVHRVDTIKVQGALLLLLRIRAADDGRQDGQGPVKPVLHNFAPCNSRNAIAAAMQQAEA